MTIIDGTKMIVFSPLRLPLSVFDVEAGSHLPDPPGTVLPNARMNRPGCAEPVITRRMCAPSAVSRLQPHRNNMPLVTVQNLASARPHSEGTGNGDKQRVVPLNRGSDVVPVGECRECDEPLYRKSRNGRIPTFCASLCRVRYWRRKQKVGG